MRDASSSALSPEELGRRLAVMGFAPGPDVASGLATYLALLMKWNAAMNLVGSATWVDALENLVADSLHLANFLPDAGLPPEPESWDLGAGAGLPGIPLRLLWRDGTYTLIEAREKRALFLRTALAQLSLPRTVAVQARAEVFFRTAGLADLIVSRAFMPWRNMLALVADRVKEGGKVLFLTLEASPDALPDGWRLWRTQEYVCRGRQRFFWCLERG